MFGSGKRNIPLKFTKFETNKPFEGVVNNLERRFRESESLAMKEELTKYQNSAPCESCKGKRLKPESLCVKIMGMDISEAH
jgi:excinuclease ABC subunit A